MVLRFLTFILIIELSLPQLFAKGAMNCAIVLSSDFQSVQDIKAALLHSQFSDVFGNTQRVFYNGRLDQNDTMTFEIPRGDLRWDSKFNAALRTDTPHRDPRYILFILGAELSVLMGYKVKFLDPQLGPMGRVQIVSPGVLSIQKAILAINEVLTKVFQHEPVGYSNVKTGVVTAREMLEATLRVDESLEYGFPFHENDALLTPHELALHGNFVVPRELLRRARNINVVVMEFADILRSHGNDALVTYARAIESNRSVENDLGSGLSTRLIAQFAESGRLQNVSSETPASRELASALATWSRPTLTAFEALVQQLTMHDPGFRTFLSRHGKTWIENLSFEENFANANPNGYVEERISGGEIDHQRMLVLLRQYQKHHRQNLRPSLVSRKSAKEWARSIFAGHGERTQEILKALIYLKRHSKISKD